MLKIAALQSVGLPEYSEKYEAKLEAKRKLDSVSGQASLAEQSNRINQVMSSIINDLNNKKMQKENTSEEECKRKLDDANNKYRIYKLLGDSLQEARASGDFAEQFNKLDDKSISIAVRSQKLQEVIREKLGEEDEAT